jgi:exosortase A-associated hydrolase 1
MRNLEKVSTRIAMNYTEKTVVFQCEENDLLGILTLPNKSAEIGVLVIVGGPQYRVGSHRQFVQLSRAIAASGFYVFRFDVRGMGDSEGEKRNFENISSDIEAAKNSFRLNVPHLKRIILWGLCDGASAALLYCYEYKDTQVDGLCLLNPWVRSDESHARNTLKFYYKNRLFKKDFWSNLFSGNISVGVFFDIVKHIKVYIKSNSMLSPQKNIYSKYSFQDISYQKKMLKTLSNFEGKILLFLSDTDFVAREFLDFMTRTGERKNFQNNINNLFVELKNTDHTFTDINSRNLVEQKTIQWIKSF